MIAAANNCANGAGAARECVLARHPLVSFFIIAYAGTWFVEVPYVRFASGAGILPFSWPIPFAVSAAVAPFAGPFLAAFIMAWVIEGKVGIVCLLRRIVRWRAGLRWYAFAIVGIPVIVVLGVIVLPGVLASFRMPDVSWASTYLVSLSWRSLSEDH